MTDILPAASPKAMKLARRLLREGEIIAFPTDEGYYLGANAFERFAVRQLYTLSNRPPEQGLLVFIYQADDLNHVAQQVPNAAWPMLNQLWPGKLTVRLPKNPALPADVTGSHSTVAVRSPNHPLCLQLVVDFGRPLTVVSAAQRSPPRQRQPPPPAGTHSPGARWQPQPR
ncbi:MAG: Sua5/YciO/YrdC/YwlC family protein [Anaerolineae bacterium]